MNMNVYMPTKLRTGEGCVKKYGLEMAGLGKSCLIVTGAHSAKACGAFDDVVSVLESANISWKLFDEIGQNPKVSDCMRAGAMARAFKADFIIGIGGGSPLDAAKAIAALAANPDMDQDELYSGQWANAPLDIVAVGTTAGTGSEVTKVSVLTRLDGHKKGLHNEKLFPVFSYGDPAYTMTLPKEFTKSTAVDALAHCIESYFNRNTNELARCYAIAGIRLILGVKRSSGDFDALTYEDRQQLYNASIYGGLAINISGTAMPHAMGYLLTELHGQPHGVACAAFMPAFYYHNKKLMPSLTESFLKEIGCDEEEFIKVIYSFLPADKYAISEEEIKREHSRWIANAGIAKSFGEITPEQADQILREI